MYTQAPLNARSVRLDRADAEYEALSYLAVGMAERHHADDVALAHGQVVVIAAPLEVLCGHPNCTYETGPGLPGRW
jgi:hypothetical protein